jgi:hypothetical protein
MTLHAHMNVALRCAIVSNVTSRTFAGPCFARSLPCPPSHPFLSAAVYGDLYLMTRQYYRCFRGGDPKVAVEPRLSGDFGGVGAVEVAVASSNGGDELELAASVGGIEDGINPLVGVGGSFGDGGGTGDRACPNMLGHRTPI